MKTITIILISFSPLGLFGQIHTGDFSQFDDKPEKYLMPEKDTMEVIKIKFEDVKKYSIKVGFCETQPIVVNSLLLNGDYFLPHRILYDEDLKSIWDLFDTEEKNYLKISTKTLIKKTVSPQPIPK